MIALQIAVGPGMKGGCQDVLDAHGDQIVVAPAHHSEVGGVRGPHLVGPVILRWYSLPAASLISGLFTRPSQRKSCGKHTGRLRVC